MEGQRCREKWSERLVATLLRAAKAMAAAAGRSRDGRRAGGVVDEKTTGRGEKGGLNGREYRPNFLKKYAAQYAADTGLRPSLLTLPAALAEEQSISSGFSFCIFSLRVCCGPLTHERIAG